MDHITMTPLAKPRTFSQALLALEQYVNDLGIQDQDPVRNRINEWKKQVPQFSVSTRGILEDAGRVFLEIKPRPGEKDAWIVVITFEHFG